MSSNEIVQFIHSKLVEAAHKDENDPDAYVQYKDIMDWAGISGETDYVSGALGTLFYEINEHDRSQDVNRPMLSAIAVGANGFPSKGLYTLARQYEKYDGRSENDELTFWMQEQRAVRKYWQSRSEATFKGQTVTYQDLQETLLEFDNAYPDSNEYDQWLEKDGYKFALSYGGRLYPPKYILSRITGIATSEFSGGEQTNRVLQQLGLMIVDKPGYDPASSPPTLSEEDRAVIAQTMELTYYEGSRVLVSSYQYERNTDARRACIQHHGLDCNVCGFNFGEVFGEIGDGFIHVHHLTPLSEQDGEYEVDPNEDLRPVCPNCHAMLHKRNPPYSIEELKRIRR